MLEVVRGNYDSLTLKMQDSLDQFERYSEKPKEMTFFLQLVSLFHLQSCFFVAHKIKYKHEKRGSELLSITSSILDGFNNSCTVVTNRVWNKVRRYVY